MKLGKRRDLLQRYGLALSWAGLSLLVRGALPVPEGTAVYQLPIVAVILSAWLGGRGPGLVALLICATGVGYWFVPPARSFAMAPGHVIGFVVFIALGLFLVEFGAARWRIQRALEESERRFRLMAEAIPEMLWFESIDPRRMLYASRKFEQIWGRPLAEIERKPDAWLDSVHSEDQLEVSTAYNRWLAGEGTRNFDATFRIVRPDGAIRFIHSRGALIRDGEGRPYRASGVAEDVTEEKGAEESLAEAKTQLAHASRLSTMGQLAASIAHEVNQPLAAMVANAAACECWLSAAPPETARAHGVLKSIMADGQRASAIIGRIRGLLKRQPAPKESIEVNDLIADVLALVRYELRRNGVSVRTQLDDGLPRILGDKVQLQQVVLNLVMNAIESMTTTDGARELVVASGRHVDSGIVVAVRDNGAGLAVETADRMFDAFYTTKSNGLGMGLAISRSTVESHGGRIWATPNEPRGAVFQFTLPVVGAAAADSRATVQTAQQGSA